LSGELRTPAFVAFMKGRGEPGRPLPAAVVARLRTQLGGPLSRQRIAAVVAVPSRTWAQRHEVAALCADVLGVGGPLELLCFREEPAARQGALCNNEQRRANVAERMGVV